MRAASPMSKLRAPRANAPPTAMNMNPDQQSFWLAIFKRSPHLSKTAGFCAPVRNAVMWDTPTGARRAGDGGSPLAVGAPGPYGRGDACGQFLAAGPMGEIDGAQPLLVPEVGVGALFQQ